MRTRLIVIACVVLAAVALGWTLRLHEPGDPRTSPADERSTRAEAAEAQAPAREPESTDATSRSPGDEGPIDVAARARFNEQAREFFAQAPALPPEEARQRAERISQELSRIERAGGMSAGETLLLRAGLIRATEPDPQRQAAQLRALKERYEADGRRRGSQPDAQSDPMFQLYKVRESEIVAEVMSLQTIPNGLSREEYLRQRLQAAREQLMNGTM
jgi:hypothetical protein